MITILIMLLMLQLWVGQRIYKRTKDKYILFIAIIPFSIIIYMGFLLLEYHNFREYIEREPNEKLNNLQGTESYKKLKEITGNPVGSFVPYCSVFEDGLIPSYKGIEIEKEKENYISIGKIKKFKFKEFISMDYICLKGYKNRLKSSFIILISILMIIIYFIYISRIIEIKYAIGITIFLIGIVVSRMLHTGCPMINGFTIGVGTIGILYIIETIFNMII